MEHPKHPNKRLRERAARTGLVIAELSKLVLNRFTMPDDYYRPSQKDVEDTREGFDSTGNFHRIDPDMPLYDIDSERPVRRVRIIAYTDPKTGEVHSMMNPKPPYSKPPDEAQ